MADIESILSEKRVFHPPEEFREKARVKTMQAYEALYERAEKDPEGYWAEVAQELSWTTPWQKVLDWTLPDAQWFVGGKTNLAYNCLDRHLRGARRNKAALIWEGEPGDVRTLTLSASCTRRCASLPMCCSEAGIGAGDGSPSTCR